KKSIVAYGSIDGYQEVSAFYAVQAHVLLADHYSSVSHHLVATAVEEVFNELRFGGSRRNIYIRDAKLRDRSSNDVYMDEQPAQRRVLGNRDDGWRARESYFKRAFLRDEGFPSIGIVVSERGPLRRLRGCSRDRRGDEQRYQK